MHASKKWALTLIFVNERRTRKLYLTMAWIENLAIPMLRLQWSNNNINSLRGKRVPQPTKKGVLREKNHIFINFWTRVLGLGAKNSSSWDLHYSRVELACWTKCCCSNWLLKLADLFLNKTQASQTAKWPRKETNNRYFLAGLRKAHSKNIFQIFFSEKRSTHRVENTW